MVRIMNSFFSSLHAGFNLLFLNLVKNPLTLLGNPPYRHEKSALQVSLRLVIRT